MTLVTAFAAAPPGRARYRPIVAALTAGFDRHRVMGGAGAAFRGLRSGNGRVADAMEGFTRLAPLWAAWLAGGGDDAGYADRIARGLTAGPAAWGPIGDRDQRLCEAADVALTLWMSRAWLAAPTRDAVLDWLAGAAGRAHADNNWHLFPATVLAVLAAMGRPAASPAPMLDRVRQWVTADGLFRDGPGGRIDWYSAWGFHYQLGWIEAVAGPTAWVEAARTAALPVVAHLLSPGGPVMFGRSLHYRAAAPAPLVIAAMLGEGEPGAARHALDTVFGHFLAHDLIVDGRVTQGYHGDQPGWVDSYAGPASPLWSLRALIPALTLAADHPFWTADAIPLPVEIADYRLAVGGCVIEGDAARRQVRLVRLIHRTSATPAPKFVRHGAIARLRDRVRGYVSRPANLAMRYDLAEYSTARPFCLQEL